MKIIRKIFIFITASLLLGCIEITDPVIKFGKESIQLVYITKDVIDSRVTKCEYSKFDSRHFMICKNLKSLNESVEIWEIVSNDGAPIFYAINETATQSVTKMMLFGKFRIGNSRQPVNLDEIMKNIQ